MDSLSPFLREIYVTKPDSRLTVKEIYEDFRAWVIGKYGMSTWNKISQRQVYSSLKTLPEYPYIRYKEGYCLKGISYRSVPPNKIPLNISPVLETKQEQEETTQDNTKAPRSPQVIPAKGPYLTLNIVAPQPKLNPVLIPQIEPIVTPQILPINKTKNKSMDNVRLGMTTTCRDTKVNIIETKTMRIVPRAPKIILPTIGLSS